MRVESLVKVARETVNLGSAIRPIRVKPGFVAASDGIARFLPHLRSCVGAGNVDVIEDVIPVYGSDRHGV